MQGGADGGSDVDLVQGNTSNEVRPRGVPVVTGVAFLEQADTDGGSLRCAEIVSASLE